ncbi:MAG: nucleotide exchange factor GrpE [Candidatus Sumerlaeota bacterium]|nr:nucleotide exchange factor GrpE [Candidatus Sumerlaeota bacterium]
MGRSKTFCSASSMCGDANKSGGVERSPRRRLYRLRREVYRSAPVAVSSALERRAVGRVRAEEIAGGIREEEAAALRAQVAQLQDQYLRARSDMENFRKRTVKEREEQRKFAGEAILKSLLETVDNLERAVLGAEQVNDIKTLHSGVELIHQQFIATLQQHGVEIIDPKPRDKFDPAKHQAVTAEISPGHEPETIIEVLQKGYLLHGRVLRAAMVKAVRR